MNALAQLGVSFVGVTQLRHTVSDAEVQALNKAGVRGIRFNLKRGGSEKVRHLVSMAQRMYEMVGWHVELYVDSKDLDDLYETIIHLPKVSIDHLGGSFAGFKTLLKCVEKQVKVKASGFGRVDFDIMHAMRQINSANPNALMFGTDLPSTRAPKCYSDSDYFMTLEALGVDAAKRVLSESAKSFYHGMGEL